MHAKFIGYMASPDESIHLALFNIVDPRGVYDGYTVGIEKLLSLGIEVPKIDSFEVWKDYQKKKS